MQIAEVGNAYRNCFGCGTDNPIGLRLRPVETADGATAEFISRPEHQGWDGVVHGGILLTLLDEILAYAAIYKAGLAVTAEIQARLRAPAPIGEKLLLSAKVTAQRRKLVECEAVIADARGQTIAEGCGKFVVVGPKASPPAMQPMDETGIMRRGEAD